MRDRSDPEMNSWGDLTERHARRVDEFIKGMIGEPTFRLSLKFLGFRGQALEAEIELANLLKKEAKNGANPNSPGVRKSAPAA